ncbi:hypothetical protein OAS86_00270 [Gammaproteobacteria bacterium]|nr:hypothetical protein [Gammaproteobacteria bacterium]
MSDCTSVQIDSNPNAHLTTAERVAAMEEALLDSIDRYDRCLEQTIENNAAEADAASSGGGGQLTGEGASSADSAERPQSEQSEEPMTEVGQSDDGEKTDSSGASNQKIDATDNDAAVCQLLKEELALEKDAEKRKELEAIYSDYNCR